MVNFLSTWQAMGCPDICLNIICRCFHMRLVFDLVNLVKQMPLSSEGGASSTPLNDWRKQKSRGRLTSFSAWLFDLDFGLLLPSVFLVLRLSDRNRNIHHRLSSSQPFELHHQLPCITSLKIADHGTSQPPKSCESIPFFYIYTISSVSLGNPG